jgi:hypothetical protein
MVVTLLIATVQAVTDPYLWMSVFPNIRLEGGRGAGLKFEPSQLASLLALYLVLLAGRTESARTTSESPRAQGSLFREAIWAILATLALTRSFSVFIIAACFAPVLLIQPRHALATISATLAATVVGFSVLGDRIISAIQTSGGSVADLMTESVGSWRNIPDLLILSNYRDCLIPGNPAEVRMKINTFAVLMSPALVWIQNTFSQFSAGGFTIGLLATVGIMIWGIAIGLKSLASSPSMRASWLMIYFAAWFFIAKWDPSVWVALGLLPLMYRLNHRGSGLTSAALGQESVSGHGLSNRKPSQSAIAQALDAGAGTRICSGARSTYVNP